MRFYIKNVLVYPISAPKSHFLIFKTFNNDDGWQIFSMQFCLHESEGKYRTVVSKLFLWLKEITVLFSIRHVYISKHCITFNLLRYTEHSHHNRSLHTVHIPMEKYSFVSGLSPRYCLPQLPRWWINWEKCVAAYAAASSLLASRVSSRSVISASSSAFVSSQKETGGKNGSHCADFFCRPEILLPRLFFLLLSPSAFNWKQQDNEGKQPVEIARPGCKTTIVKTPRDVARKFC